MKWFICIAFFTTLQLCAQSNIKPTIGVNYSYQFYNSFYISNFDRVYTHNFDLSGGIRIKEYLFLDVNIGVMLGQFNLASAKQMISFNNSIGLNYRVLKPKHIVSPMIGADFGYEISSNARGKFVSSKYNGIVDKNNIYADPKFIYNKNRYFGRVKMLLDLEYNNISFRTGLNFNFSSFNQTNFEYKYGQMDYSKSTRTNKFYMNIGIEAGMMYTFPMKKQQAKKALE